MLGLHTPFLLLISLIFVHLSHATPVILKGVHEEHIPFESLRGKWVFLNYWADWCQPCIEEISELNRFYKHQKDKVAVFGINYDEPPVAQQLALIKKYRIHYPNLQTDPAADLFLEDIRGVPVTFVFDPQGKLNKVLYGGQTVSSLTKLMKKKFLE